MNEQVAGDVPDTIGQWLQSIGQLGLGVVLLLLAVGAIWALIKLWPVLTSVVSIGNALLALPVLVPQMQTLTHADTGVSAQLDTVKDQLGAVQHQVDRVVHEVFPNSGSSLRDKIDKTHDEFIDHRARTEERLDSFDRDLRGVRGSITSLHAKLKPIQQATVLEDTITPAQLAVLAVDPHATEEA